MLNFSRYNYYVYNNQRIFRVRVAINEDNQLQQGQISFLVKLKWNILNTILSHFKYQQSSVIIVVLRSLLFDHKWSLDLWKGLSYRRMDFNWSIYSENRIQNANYAIFELEIWSVWPCATVWCIFQTKTIKKWNLV